MITPEHSEVIRNEATEISAQYKPFNTITIIELLVENDSPVDDYDQRMLIAHVFGKDFDNFFATATKKAKAGLMKRVLGEQLPGLVDCVDSLTLQRSYSDDDELYLMIRVLQERFGEKLALRSKVGHFQPPRTSK